MATSSTNENFEKKGRERSTSYTLKECSDERFQKIKTAAIEKLALKEIPSEKLNPSSKNEVALYAFGENTQIFFIFGKSKEKTWVDLMHNEPPASLQLNSLEKELEELLNAPA